MQNLDILYNAILTGNLELAVSITKEAVENNIQPKKLIDEYMATAMQEVGARFEAHQVFVPELLMAGRAMKGALEVLRPAMVGNTTSMLGKIIIGTVKGDLHDIGKNLVAYMFEGSGFEVINLGIDIPSEKFIEAAREHEADIVCMSALLTTTMIYMKEVISAFEEAGLRQQVKIMVGGAPVNQKFAEEIGADGYSSNANAAVTLAKSLLAHKSYTPDILF